MSMSCSITAFRKRGIRILRLYTLENEKKKKSVKIENQKMTAPSDNKAATRLHKCMSVDVVPAAFAKVVVLTSLSDEERPVWG